MPVFTPGRRWQPPFNSFKKEPFGNRLLASVEKVVKGSSLGMPYVWKLPFTGNCFYLLDGMPKRYPKWALWRLGIRALLCG